MKYKKITRESLEGELEAYGLPTRMAGALDRYLNHKIQPGDFLTAILAGDLLDAAARADSQNKNLLYEWAKFVNERMPFHVCGSRENIKKWVNKE